MRKLKKIFRNYLPFSRSVLQRKMSYKLDFFMSIIGQLVKCFVVYFLWKAVYLNSNSISINGYSADEMIVYVFMSAITANIVSNTVDVEIGGEVWDGSIIMNLIKPVNFQLKLFFESLAELLQGTVWIALPIWLGMVIIRFITSGKLPPAPSTIFLYLLSAFLGFIILFLINFSFGILSFYVTNIWGIRNLKYVILDFLSGVIVPLAFLPIGMQKALSFVPFASVNYVPVTIYLEKVSTSSIFTTFVVQIVWIVIMFVISLLLWNKAVKHLTVLGG